MSNRNNKYPYACKLQMPFDRPFSDEDWFVDLVKNTIPSYWWDWQPQYRDIEYVLHPLKEEHFSERKEIIKWDPMFPRYFGQIDITDNEISGEFIHPRFTRLLSDRGLEIINWDVFITPPNMRLSGHKDTETETVKLNFAHQFTPDISQQNYLKETDDVVYKDGNEAGDTDVRESMLGGEVIHWHNLSNEWNQPSLTNVGLWHEVINRSPQPRICLSYQLKLKKHRHVSLYQEVYPLLEDLIIE